MLEFKYKIYAITKSGEKIEENKFSSSKNKLFKELRKQNLNNIKINLNIESIEDIKFSESKLNAKEHEKLFEELYDFIRLGNNITESLEFIERNTKNQKIKSLMKNSIILLKGGASLSEAFDASKLIDTFAVTVIKTAEETGNYDLIFKSLTEYYADRAEMQGKIKSALVKPTIIMIALSGAAYYLITNVIPKIGGLFTGTKVQPPLPTKILLNINDFLTNYSLLFFVSFILFIYSIYWFFTSEKTAKYKLKLPIVGKLKRLEFQTEFLMSYYLLLKYGVSTKRTINLIKSNTKDMYFYKIYDKLEQKIESGIPLSKAIKTEPLFDEILTSMFEKGESTGTTNQVTEKLYFSYKERTKKFLEYFPTLLDNVSLLIGGAIILFIFLGIMSPVVVFIKNASSM